MSELGPIDTKRLTGHETVHERGRSLGFSVLEFWQWSASDLVSNATRGILAEYLVAHALGVEGGVRDEWAAYDVTAKDGTQIEVKSAAYIQSWHQHRPSQIVFRIRKTRAWDRESNRQSDEVRRQADVYVFAILAHREQATLDPLDVSQWRFFVVPTFHLDSRKRSQYSITLPSLEALAGEPVGFDALAKTVEQAGRVQRELANKAMQTDRPSAGR